jgi:non-heme chloroperoxidase
MCLVRELASEELYLMLGFNASVPPHVRQALFSRTVDNEDLLPTIRKPVLITHGKADAVVKPMVVEQHKAALPHAEVHLMEGAGHAPFWDDAPNFNARQRAFFESLG